jgi:hypothetical protein
MDNISVIKGKIGRNLRDRRGCICRCFVDSWTDFDPKNGETFSYKIRKKCVRKELVVFTNRISCGIQFCIKGSSEEVKAGFV